MLLSCDIKLFMQLKYTVIWITKQILGDYWEVLLKFIPSGSLKKVFQTEYGENTFELFFYSLSNLR